MRVTFYSRAMIFKKKCAESNSEFATYLSNTKTHVIVQVGDLNARSSRYVYIL